MQSDKCYALLAIVLRQEVGMAFVVVELSFLCAALVSTVLRLCHQLEKKMTWHGFNANSLSEQKSVDMRIFRQNLREQCYVEAAISGDTPPGTWIPIR